MPCAWQDLPESAFAAVPVMNFLSGNKRWNTNGRSMSLLPACQIPPFLQALSVAPACPEAAPPSLHCTPCAT